MCRRFEVVTNSGAGVEDLHDVAAKELDPAMVQRFTAMLRADLAARN